VAARRDVVSVHDSAPASPTSESTTYPRHPEQIAPSEIFFPDHPAVGPWQTDLVPEHDIQIPSLTRHPPVDEPRGVFSEPGQKVSFLPARSDLVGERGDLVFGGHDPLERRTGFQRLDGGVHLGLVRVFDLDRNVEHRRVDVAILVDPTLVERDGSLASARKAEQT
jgi:hypothetical protein